jgi:hypothetical protein
MSPAIPWLDTHCYWGRCTDHSLAQLSHLPAKPEGGRGQAVTCCKDKSSETSMKCACNAKASNESRHGCTCAAQDSSILALPVAEPNRAADHHMGWAECAPCPPAWQQAAAGTQEYVQLCAAARTDIARATLRSSED